MPGAGPGITFDEDVLRGGAGAADAVDGRLVHGGDDGVVFVVELVVGVEDDLFVGRVPLRHGRPPCLESCAVRDHIAVVAPEVVRVDDCVGTPGNEKRAKVSGSCLACQSCVWLFSLGTVGCKRKINE